MRGRRGLYAGTVLVAVVTGCSAGGRECSIAFASCAGLVEVSGETWHPIVMEPDLDLELVGPETSVVEHLCPSVTTCDDGTTTYGGPKTRELGLRRIEGIPAGQALARVDGGLVTVYVPGTGNVDDPRTGTISPKLKRLLR